MPPVVSAKPLETRVLKTYSSNHGSALHSTKETGATTRPVAPMANSPKLADGHSQEQQKVIDYAWEISNNMRFIYLLTAENGQYNHDRVHPNHANTVGTDRGYCGINDYYHPTIINDPRFLSDWKWQMRECLRLYQNGTTFYGIIRYDKDPNYRQQIHNKFK